MTSSNDTRLAAFEQLLSELDIEPCFHSLIITMCSGKESYLKDIEAQDLEGELEFGGKACSVALRMYFTCWQRILMSFLGPEGTRQRSIFLIPFLTNRKNLPLYSH